ncbi:hypothetical protein CDL15_Pgr010883 [Punica granatum]|uniref:Uncharacterized protein n=1 Tax=Punica granatum TaxID=22663 RepID=A0A218Y0J7_PUNGR|nr:hypothetical protein CDL15_Pgr010883 [Punica granatum]PKI67208.1 hypothetical protein CRG98_012405 [Punica granatum]
MYEEKSRGSGRGSHKTRIEGYGWVTRMWAAVAVRGKMGRHASSEHGTVRGRVRWTLKRRIYTTMGRPERAKA